MIAVCSELIYFSAVIWSSFVRSCRQRHQIRKRLLCVALEGIVTAARVPCAVCPFSSPVLCSSAPLHTPLIAERAAPGLRMKCLKAPVAASEDSWSCSLSTWNCVCCLLTLFDLESWLFACLHVNASHRCFVLKVFYCDCFGSVVAHCSPHSVASRWGVTAWTNNVFCNSIWSQITQRLKIWSHY